MKNAKIRAFVPGKTVRPEIPVRPLDGSLPVSGAVRMPKGDAWGVERGGRIVAWAVLREPDGRGFRHITVETDVHHRGRGYASACVQAALCEADGPVLYLCSADNEKSARTALRAGMVEIDWPLREENE